MRAQGLPALFSLALSLAVFVSGSVVVSAQIAEAQSDGTSSGEHASVLAGSNAPRLSNGAVAPVTAIPQGKSETVRIEADLKAFQEMLQRHRAIGNVAGEAQAFAAIASSYRALKQEQRAIDNFQSALAAWHELGRSRDEATTVAHMGDVYREWGFSDRAVVFYRKALKMYSRLSDKKGEAITRNNIAVAYLTLNDKRGCFKYLHQALILYRTDRDRHREATTLSNLATAHMFFLAKEPGKALDELRQVLAEVEPLGDADSEANVLEMMGIAQLRLNRKKMAKESFQRALALYQAAGDARGRSTAASHMQRIVSLRPYRAHQLEAVGMAIPDPLRLRSTRLRVLDEWSAD